MTAENQKISSDREVSRRARASAIHLAGGIEKALASGSLPAAQDLSVSEALVLGLLRQGVSTYIGIFGHGMTDVGDALRVYEEAGLVRIFNVRSEIEASHAATALKWQYGETAAVFTSIGPGALQALSASLTPSSNGIGLYYLFGDETTHDEGFNMQQIPGRGQSAFLKLASAMGGAYSLHTGQALGAALKKAAATVFSPIRAQPFFLLLPMNEQAHMMQNFNINELPVRPDFFRAAPADDAPFLEAVRLLSAARKVTVKTGNGARSLDAALLGEFLDRVDGAYVHGPSAVGILPGSHPRNMTVGGSKGSPCGNAAMAEADLVVTIGARSVCQWDSSGTAWKNAKRFIGINTSHDDAAHYNGSLALVGDSGAVLEKLVAALRKAGVYNGNPNSGSHSPWYVECRALRTQWDNFLTLRRGTESLPDQKFGIRVMTEPVAIGAAADFARSVDAIKYFDAGDVQANGFQLVEDEKPGRTFTDTGASYMGFACSAILASAFAKNPAYPMAFTGDGSFLMNPQILVDAVQHGLRGMIVLFDNRRMAAISSLQKAQYGRDFKTDDTVEVDYACLAQAIKGVRAFHGGYSAADLKIALAAAYAYQGLSLVHVPVYSGTDERGGLGSYGDWNVGCWCERVQGEKHRLGF